MAVESRHISEWIERPAGEVYDYARDPVNLPEWAAGLGSSVQHVDGRWFADSPMGRVVHNPVRVIPGGDASEIVFTLRRPPGVPHADFARDAATVASDLKRLKQILEA